MMTQLDLMQATQAGFSGGDEVARCIGTYGREGVAKAVFARAAPPYL